MAHPSLSLSTSTSSPGEDPRPQNADGAEEEKPASNEDPKQVVASLRAEIGQGHWDLNISLERIAETAQMLTDGNGAAIAMRHEGVIVCQARAGEMAPALGTKLDLNSGISGECLRTARAVRCEDTTNDARVDPEVRSQLGLWSLAAVPLGKEPDVIGILEVFSALPYSFSLWHLELLEELAELAMAVHRGSILGAAGEASEISLRSRVAAAWIPAESAAASGGFGDRAGRWFKTARETLVEARRTQAGRRTLALYAMAALAASLGMGWLFGHSRPAKTLPETKAAVAASPARANSADTSTALVWNSNSAPVAPTQNVKPSPSSELVMAGKREKVEKTVNALSGPDALPKTDTLLTPEPEVYVRRADVPNKAAAGATTPVSDDAAESAPALTMARTNSENPLGGVLSAPMSLPEPAVRVSEGLTEGVVMHRVQPIYPQQARTLRLEGSVVLQAVVTEDGAVHQVKVMSGPPLLARAAQNAVAQWRYRPFQLNGKPIAMRTEIKVDFKLPAQ